jgi:Ni2+-binding GTPase involved in maturation of urease and hydrogenase
MVKLKLFLVGGFLGSGKTTAIQQAALFLQKNNRKVGVITNDQGTQQVDTQFMKGQNIPSEEVAGGCFCCKYNDLEKRIQSLKFKERPEIIFAESVGSCADLAATVVNPLLSFNPDEYQIVLSVFADIRLLIRFLQNEKDIFYDNVNYIYEKQLEEADIIVVNKTDLLTPEQLFQAKQRIDEEYRNKIISYQNSLSVESIGKWVSLICDEFKNETLRPSLEIDYDIYGAGEAELAWLDEEIGIVSENNTAVSAGYLLIRKIYNKIVLRGYPIGHLKFLMDNGRKQQKISYATMADSEITEPSFAETGRIIILINARVQVNPARLEEIMKEAIHETEAVAHCKIIEQKLSAFQPGYPRPTHRIAFVR